jgi:UDP-N-acetylglucosamine acyltransferase
MPKIHPSAIVDPAAKIADSVEVGPFCVIGPNAVIGEGTKLGPGVIVDGWTTIGRGNVIMAWSVIGSPPQDFSWKAERSYLRIGDNNIIHEYVTFAPGTKPETETVVGSNCMFMVHSHVGHNCRVGDNVILVNNVALGGYVEIGDRAFISAASSVHQFCRVGRLCMIGALCKPAQDIPPFMLAQDCPAVVYTLNVVGMTRAGMTPETRARIKRAYKLLYHDKYNFSDAVKAIEGTPELIAVPEVKELTEFVKSAKRGICAHHR